MFQRGFIGAGDALQRTEGEASRTHLDGLRIGDEGSLREIVLIVLLAEESHGLVLVAAVIPESECGADFGAAPLVHEDRLVGSGGEHETVGIGRVRRGLDDEERGSRGRRGGRAELAFLGSRGDVEFLTGAADEFIARRVVAHEFPELSVAAVECGGFHLSAVGLCFQHVVAVEKLDEIPHLLLFIACHRQVGGAGGEEGEHSKQKREKFLFHG